MIDSNAKIEKLILKYEILEKENEELKERLEKSLQNSTLKNQKDLDTIKNLQKELL